MPKTPPRPTPPRPAPASQWIVPKDVRVSCCEARLPGVVDVPEQSIWKCPKCRRRWRLAIKHVSDGLPIGLLFAEGVAIIGPDGSQYWRACRARFVGRIGL